jgi:6-phosphogluconolactonase
MPTLRRLVPALLLLLGAFGAAGHAQRATSPSSDILVYVGTYTGEKSKGIYVTRMNTATGHLTEPELAAEIASPSFLAVHPTRNLLYSVNEVNTFQGKQSGGVSAFSIDRTTGKLTLLNQESSVGGGPAHLIVDKEGRNVLVANYGGGSIAVLPIDADGKLKPASSFVQHTGSSLNPSRQKEPHAHSINVDAADRFAYVADLGLDKVLVYRYDSAKGTLTPNEPAFATVKPGSGPRHFALHPTGKFAYVINELTCTVTAFANNAARGALSEIQTVSTLPESTAMQPQFSGSEVQVHPSGKFLYAANRGHDTIAVFTIDQASGRLTLVQNQLTLGNIPRGFGIDPGGRFLLAGNQKSDSLIVYRIDQQSGRLTPTGQKLDIGSPVSVKFVK